jgi:AcrR family transcriptional regulator
VFEAAIRVYGEVGWAGFTFDAVAARARAGKASIYRRWESKLDILLDALRAANAGFVEVPDTGELRADLVSLARAIMVRFDQPVGLAELRLMVDMKAFPEEFSSLRPTGTVSRRIAREAVDRAVARGELPAGTRPEIVFDLVRGAVVQNFLLVPPGMEDAWRDRCPAFAEEIVDTVLAGLNACSPGGPGTAEPAPAEGSANAE